MKANELAREKCNLVINLNSMCDIRGCFGKVQIVLITSKGVEWQLCTVCYDEYLKAVLELQKRDAVEHPVEPTGAGLTVTESITGDKTGAYVCQKCGTRYLWGAAKCRGCGNIRPYIPL